MDYKSLLNKDADAWTFVEAFHLKYGGSQLVADANDLEVLLNEPEIIEEGSGAHYSLHNEYGGDLNNPQIETDYHYIHFRLYQEAIECFIHTLQEENKNNLKN